MGFFDFFRKGRPERPEEESVRLRIGEVVGFLEKRFSKDMEEVREELNRICQDVLENFSGIESSLQELGKAGFGGDDKAFVAANMVKDTFVRKSLSAVREFNSKYPKGLDADFTALSDLKTEAEKVLKELEVNPKQIFLLSRYFVRESQEAVESIKKAEIGIKKLGAFLSQDSKLLKTQTRVVERVEEITGNLEGRARLEKRCDDIGSEIRAKERLVEVEKKKIEELENSRECRRLRAAEKKLEEAEAGMEAIRRRIYEELSFLKRPVKKLLHSGTSKEGELIWLKQPFKAVVTRGPGSLRKLLSELQAAVSENRISIKSREEKKLKALKRKLEKEIPSLLDRYGKLEKEMEERRRMLKGLKGMEERRSGYKENIKRYEKSIEKLEEELEDCQKQLKNLEADIGKGKEKLKELLKDFGLRAEIVE